MDIRDEPELHDLLSVCGFLYGLRMTLRLKAGGLLWGGIPCSSWVWLNSKNTRRTSTRPWGSQSYLPNKVLAFCASSLKPSFMCLLDLLAC